MSQITKEELKKVQDTFFDSLQSKLFDPSIDFGIWIKEWTLKQWAIRNGVSGRPYERNSFFLSVQSNDTLFFTKKEIEILNEKGKKENEKENTYIPNWYIKPWEKPFCLECWYSAPKKDINGNPVLNSKGKQEYFFWINFVEVYGLSQLIQNETVTQYIERKGYNDESKIINHNTNNQFLFDRINSIVQCTIIEKESNKAFYNPLDHSIILPCIWYFNNVPSFESVMLHELAHATKKELVKRDFSYATEELVAESTSLFFSYYIWIGTEETTRNSIAYLKSWMNKESNGGDKKEMLLKAFKITAKIFEHFVNITKEDTEKEIITVSDTVKIKYNDEKSC